MEEPSTTSASSAASEKHHHDGSTAGGSNGKTAQCSVVSIYQTKIADVPRNVTVTWSKNLINHSLAVTVEKPGADGPPFTCKVDLKPWPFWSKKGLKSFEVDSHRVDLFWDLRSAKYSTGPEPLGGYYVALVCNEEVILLIGDSKKEAYKRTKSRPSLEDAALITKKENVFGKKSFTSRARFDERKKEHDIVVENSISGPKEPEMWISVDGVRLIHVNNLQWKFRGNETVLIEDLPVQIFWDVHSWLFGTPGVGHALFIFKPGAPPKLEERNDNGSNEGSNHSQREEDQSLAVQSNNSAVVPEFCFFLYAWKIE